MAQITDTLNQATDQAVEFMQQAQQAVVTVVETGFTVGAKAVDAGRKAALAILGDKA